MWKTAQRATGKMDSWLLWSLNFTRWSELAQKTNKCNVVAVAAEVSGQTSRKNRALIWGKGLQKAEVCRAWFYASFRTLRGIFFVIQGKS